MAWPVVRSAAGRAFHPKVVSHVKCELVRVKFAGESPPKKKAYILYIWHLPVRREFCHHRRSRIADEIGETGSAGSAGARIEKKEH